MDGRNVSKCKKGKQKLAENSENNRDVANFETIFILQIVLRKIRNELRGVPRRSISGPLLSEKRLKCSQLLRDPVAT